MDSLNTLLMIKIITILVTMVYCYLVIVGRISAENFEQVFLMIASFYFGQSSARNYVNTLNK
jgi:hypothetical protein